MSYQVLARKWRPKNFAEMAGQQHVLQGLMHAIEMGRVHHAYLFTGTRGVGKTTIARIIAKCLNCEKGVTAEPCGQCDACQSIDAGRFIDLIEIDAASRTKVEDTRELLDNVQYAPTQGRFKIYLIDEVHMLSTHSFNALLKTLEEPPEHVKFLLATTDPQKLPVTVLSRCLQFHLRNLEPAIITERLQDILQAEKIRFEAPALALLARAANGSMRDGLSLLDQAIAFGQGEVKTTSTATMLGAVDQALVVDLINAVLAQDAVVLFEAIGKVHEQGGHYTEALANIAQMLHVVAAKQQLPRYPVEFFDAQQIDIWAQQVTSTVLQVLYQITVTCQRDLILAPDAKTGFEMAMLRLLAFRPTFHRQNYGNPVSANKGSDKSVAAARKVERPVGQNPGVVVSNPEKALLQMKGWHEIVDQLSLNGMVKQFAQNASLISLSDAAIVIQVATRHEPMVEKLKQPLQAAIQDTFGVKVNLEVVVGEHAEETPAVKQQRETAAKQAAAHQSITQDANVKFLQENFNAIIDPNSVQPLEAKE